MYSPHIGTLEDLHWGVGTRGNWRGGGGGSLSYPIFNNRVGWGGSIINNNNYSFRVEIYIHLYKARPKSTNRSQK